jgi:hypothetical protein
MKELEKFRELINSSIDGRTKDGIVLKRIKEGLEKGGKEALKEVYKNTITFNLLLEKRLIDSILNEETVIDSKGRLIPAVKSDLKDLQKSTLSFVKMLNELEEKSENEFNVEDMFNE